MSPATMYLLGGLMWLAGTELLRAREWQAGNMLRSAAVLACAAANEESR